MRMRAHSHMLENPVAESTYLFFLRSWYTGKPQNKWYHNHRLDNNRFMCTSLVTIDTLYKSFLFSINIDRSHFLLVYTILSVLKFSVPLTKVCSHCLATGHLNNMQLLQYRWFNYVIELYLSHVDYTDYICLWQRFAPTVWLQDI